MDTTAKINAAELWEQLFGKIWPAITGAGILAGAFLLDDNEERAVCDNGAVYLFGLSDTAENNEVSYSEIRGVLDRLIELQNDGLPLTLSFVDDVPKGVTAGIVALNEKGYRPSQLDGALFSQAELFDCMGNNAAPLMLIKIQGTEGSPAEQSCCISSAVKTILDMLPEGAMMAQREKDEFWILLSETGCDPLELAAELRSAVEKCRLIDSLGSLVSERHYMTLITGICDDDMIPSYKMHAATFALYQAMASGEAGEERFKSEQYKQQKSEYGDMVKFSKLLEQNLFTYHFQPIVSAHTGEVEAYELLMRTPPEIGFDPIAILDLAARFGRLYDIELATVRNAMSILSENQSYFENRHLFINAISSHILTDEDFNDIKSMYGELTEKLVVELTEQTELDDDRLNYMLDRIKSANMQLAIDDYGTGYSNTSNLLRYKPKVVKIDRSLISGIESNPRMQKLVTSVIDFLHASGMLALGEGVETLDEVRTLINMGVDLFQGFYISRPKPVFVNSIAEEVRQEIVNINLEAAGLIKKFYHAADGETISMQKLALEKYSDIFIEKGKVTLIGSSDKLLKLPITFGDGANCEVILRNVGIEVEDEEPTIKLGEDCRVKLVCEGRVRLEHSGIFVPGGSELHISGVGDMTISTEANDTYAIGNRTGLSYGNITSDLCGKLELNVNGENCVGIGGGKSGAISIRSGVVNIICTSGSCVGIGSTSGGAKISLSSCAVNIKAAAATAVCIGSMQGNAVIDISDTAVDCNSSGNRLCGIGTLEGSRTKISFSDLYVNTVMRGKNIISIGSYGGVTDCEIKNASLSVYAEGGRVSGVGDMAGSGSVIMKDSEISVTFLAAECFDIGSPNGTSEFHGVVKHIRINE